MKKVLLFVLTAACIAGVFLLMQDDLLNEVKTFKDAFGEVKQWETLK